MSFSLTVGAPTAGEVRTVSDGTNTVFNAGAILFSGAIVSGGFSPVATVTVGGTIPVTPQTAPMVVSGGATVPAAAPATVLQLAGATTGGTRILVDAFGGNPQFTGRRADTSSTAPSAVQVDEALLTLNGFGYGATGYSSAVRATIALNAAEAWSDSAQGTYFQWITTATGGTATNEKMRLSAAGALLVGTTAAVASEKLRVVGGAVFDTTGFNNTAPIARPTVTGSRGGNAALASFLTALANYGLITDSTSA